MAISLYFNIHVIDSLLTSIELQNSSVLTDRPRNHKLVSRTFSVPLAVYDSDESDFILSKVKIKRNLKIQKVKKNV